MRFSDSLLGALLIAFAVAVIAHASGFPPMPGQAFGPGLFPSVVASGLILASLGLVISGLRGGQRQPLLELDGWVSSPRLLFDFFLVIGGLLLYILSSE